MTYAQELQKGLDSPEFQQFMSKFVRQPNDDRPLHVIFETYLRFKAKDK